MIEFTGELSGNTKKYYMKRNISFWRKYTLFGSLIVVIPLMVFSIINHITILFYINGVVLLVSYFSPCIINFVNGVMPEKICIDGDNIFCNINGQLESVCLEDVKEVRDYGEFYSFMFTNGQYTPHFVCQKDLLSKGTIDDFERLFSGKIVKTDQSGTN